MAASNVEKMPTPYSVDVSKLHIISIDGNGNYFTPVSKDILYSQQKCLEYLGSLGCTTQTIHQQANPHLIPGLEQSFSIWTAMIHFGETNRTKFSHLLMDKKRPFNAMKEIWRFITLQSPHTLPAIVLAAIEDATSETVLKKFLDVGTKLKEKLLELLGNNGVILFPVYGTPAPLHNKALFPFFNVAYSCIFNVMELPCTVVPLGLNKNGLPLGIQVVGAPYKDYITIAVAMELEKKFGGWTPPPNIDCYLN